MINFYEKKSQFFRSTGANEASVDTKQQKKTNAILQQNKSFDLFNRQQYKTNTIVCYKNFFLYKTNKKTLENW